MLSQKRAILKGYWSPMVQKGLKLNHGDLFRRREGLLLAMEQHARNAKNGMNGKGDKK